MTNKKKTIPAHYSWNSSIFTRGVVDPIKRKLGYVDENEHPVSLKESATGQELDRMNDTAKKAATIAMTGLGVSSVPALARYTVSLPQVTIPEIATGLGTGIAGSKVGEKVDKALGGDGYWGSLIGGLGIGAAGVKGLNALRSAPKIVGKGNALGYRLLKETPNLNTSAQLKYYGPTMGKSYAQKYNDNIYKGALNQAGRGLQLTLKSKGNQTPPGDEFLKRYYDGKWNMENVLGDFRSGRSDALDFLRGKVFLDTAQHNSELANKIGYNKFFNFAKNAANRAETKMQLERPNKALPRADGSKTWLGLNENGFYLDVGRPVDGIAGEVSISSYKPEWDTMTLNYHGDLSDSAFHEFLHRGDVGSAPHMEISPNYTFDNFKQTGDFFNWKLKHLVKPNSDPYIGENAHEAAVNALEIGRRAGITPGQVYPGKEKALEIYKNIINNDLRKGNILTHFKWEEKPRRVWSALNGTYFKSGGIIPYLHDNNMLVFKDNKLYIRKKPKYYRTLPPLNLEPIKELEQLGKNIRI